MAKATKATETTTLAQSPEVKMVQELAAQMVSFITSMVAHLTKARALETRALETLAAAKALMVPTDAAGDLAVKEFVRAATADKKEVEEHWKITTVFHKFHKLLTGNRDRAVNPLEEAVAIGTRHHNEFVRAEARRVQEEADRKRREEEERAAAERKKELDKLEADALALEAESQALSDREIVFVNTYFANGRRGIPAAQAAGYKDPVKQAERLLATKKILDAIERKQQAETLRQQAAATASMPLETKEIVVESQADTKGDRTTKSAVVFDEKAFLEAACRPDSGIPIDCLTFKQTVLNDYARKLGKMINAWPGVRYTEKTGII